MTMEEILEFNDKFTFDAKDMIEFSTWWQGAGPHFGPGPTSPDLKDWIEIYRS